MSVMRRWECPEHGETQLQFRGPLTTERVRVCPCGKEAVQVEYVPAEQLRGAVSRLERVGQLGEWLMRDRCESDKVLLYAQELLRLSVAERPPLGGR
jgi:hypothetical protein